MRVIPNPKVMPCTAPNPSATAAMPISAPLATGANPKASAGSDRYTANNSVTTSMLLAIDRRTAACSILARAPTANTPGPLSFKRRSAARPADDSCTGAANAARTAAANAARTAAMARSCASVSEPPAAVCATIRARAPPGETQTPSLVGGEGVRSS